MVLKCNHSGKECKIEDDLQGSVQTVQGPDAGDKDWHKELSIDLSHIKYDKKDSKKGKDGQRKAVSLEDQFMMTQIQPATRNAKLFSVRYYTNVQTHFEGCVCCCNETPDAKVPMTIHPMVNPACFGFTQNS